MAMAEKLNASGAETTAVPINDRKVIVDIAVPAGVDDARLHADLTRSGISVERSNMYRLAFSAAMPRPERERMQLP